MRGWSHPGWSCLPRNVAPVCPPPGGGGLASGRTCEVVEGRREAGDFRGWGLKHDVASSCSPTPGPGLVTSGSRSSSHRSAQPRGGPSTRCAIPPSLPDLPAEVPTLWGGVEPSPSVCPTPELRTRHCSELATDPWSPDPAATATAALPVPARGCVFICTPRFKALGSGRRPQTQTPRTSSVTLC